jgi:hypothetical protein
VDDMIKHFGAELRVELINLTMAREPLRNRSDSIGSERLSDESGEMSWNDPEADYLNRWKDIPKKTLNSLM